MPQKYTALADVWREFLGSAKGAARTAKEASNCLAPLSVLRKSLSGPLATRGAVQRLRHHR